MRRSADASVHVYRTPCHSSDVSVIGRCCVPWPRPPGRALPSERAPGSRSPCRCLAAPTGLAGQPRRLAGRRQSAAGLRWPSPRWVEKVTVAQLPPRRQRPACTSATLLSAADAWWPGTTRGSAISESPSAESEVAGGPVPATDGRDAGRPPSAPVRRHWVCADGFPCTQDAETVLPPTWGPPSETPFFQGEGAPRPELSSFHRNSSYMHLRDPGLKTAAPHGGITAVRLLPGSACGRGAHGMDSMVLPS